MPEYLAPGVYVEEVPFSAKPIEGVGTSTTGFVGIARFAQLDRVLGPFASLFEFEQRTGATPNDVGTAPDFLSHAVRAFFAEGGNRLWIAPVSSEALGSESASRAIHPVLEALVRIDDVSIIAAPGLTYTRPGWTEHDAATVSSMLLARAAPKRVALLDPPQERSADQMRHWRSRFDSSYGALYYPWVRAGSPTGVTHLLPPSAFVAGVLARSDSERGVWKAPTDVALRSATGLESDVDSAEQQRLNDDGINAIRRLPQGDIRLWGNRTVARDSEWKYVNIRRYAIYLEASIAKGTQWAVFEPKDDALQAQLRHTIEAFLDVEWRHGALAGDRAHDAYFVRCDRSTTTQNDVDNGRLIVLVGVAPLRPAEFVIFRIGLETRKRAR